VPQAGTIGRKKRDVQVLFDGTLTGCAGAALFDFLQYEVVPLPHAGKADF
jgi:hypothetical protein